MHCPFCRNPESRVVDSRLTDDGTSIRRRRQCPHCSRRFTTVETTSLAVIKRSGVAEPFSKTKIINGLRKACQGRPVSDDDLALLAQEVEEKIRAAGVAEIDVHEVGLTILEPLKKLDEVAYLRFASVYQAFDSLDDFEAAIAKIRADQEITEAIELPGMSVKKPPRKKAVSKVSPSRARRKAKEPQQETLI
ncbi:MAG: transcriptional regulator NrdR [Micrococcaceae bacterium]